MAKSIPWNEIKNQWVTTDVSFNQLAKAFDINVGTVSRRAEKEDWQSERKAFQQKATEKTVELISDERAKINRRHYELWGFVIDKLEAALRMALELDEIETLTKALERAHKGQRLAKELDKAEQPATSTTVTVNLNDAKSTDPAELERMYRDQISKPGASQ